MAAILDSKERIETVQLDGLALLKIVKHCHESLPQMVTGSLLGLANSNGVLEVTHAFPFPESASSDATVANASSGDDDGQDFQLEMMRMLREVNVDNNCVGWYQSMYLGSYSTSSFLENQFSYQTELSPNAVVLLYDPLQTSHGSLVLKCFRLTETYLKHKVASSGQIFEEVPIKLTNPGLSKALVFEMKSDTTFDSLDLSTNPYLEKHLEFLCSWVDDLSQEQHKFQYWARASKRRSTSNKDPPDAPRRLESLLITNQIRNYCNQMDKFAGGGFGKLFLASGLHQQDQQGSK